MFTALPPPVVSVTSEGTQLAGESQLLTCTISVIEGLVNTSTLQYTWTDAYGSPISGDDIRGDSSSLGTSSNISLKFIPLRTSHGGQYVCRAMLRILEIYVTVNSSYTADMVVKSEYLVK